jgi:ankyrin repeat protein
MQRIYKEYRKAQCEGDAEFDQLSDLFPNNQQQSDIKKERELSLYEKKYLLAIERGDIATVKYYLDNVFDKFDKNAVDPLGRSALHIAIEYENIEMIEVLLNSQVDIGEGILHAINEEFVEAVEMLLNYQDNGGNLVDVIFFFTFKI